MLDQIETINDGWLETRELKDQPGVHVIGSYKRPLVPATAHIKFAAVTAVALFIYFLATTTRHDPVTVLFSAMLFTIPVYAFLGALVVRPVLMLIPRDVDVKVLAEHIQIKKGRRYRTYSRNVPIEFRVEQHHKAAKEEMEEQKRGKPGNRWYREAIEVVMQYGEKRIPIAEMHMLDLEKAKALVIRLQSWCESFDQAVKRMADGQISPAGEMGAVSGGDFGPTPDIR